MRGCVFAMNWFRSNKGHGARLALFALLVQFALSFGHSHGVAQAASLAQATASFDHTALSKQSPAQPDQDQSDDICAICAVVAMAGTILFASPPVLLLPQAIDFLYRILDAEFVHLSSASTAFQPRAPPAS